jgi:glucitol operon activator protein
MMDQTTLMILIAIGAWALQIVLGFFQVRAFNRNLQEVAQNGSIKIGKTKSRWKARTLVLFAVDEDNRIQDARVMKGISIFARPKVLPQLIGLTTPIAKPVLASLDKSIQEAVSVAFE